MNHPGAFDSIWSAFRTAVRDHGERPFLRVPAEAAQSYAATAIEYSYASALRAVTDLRARYRMGGLRLGDRVALAFDSRLDVYLHLLALNAEGASIVPLNLSATDEELLHILRHSESRLLGGAEEHESRLKSLAADVAAIEFCDFSATACSAGKGATIPASADQELPGGLDTEAALLYTSGTTGKPKGCMLSNDYFLTMGAEYRDLGGLCAIGREDRLLTPLPPNHMNALATSFMAMLMCGGCVIQLDRFHPKTWWRTVREEGATVIHYLGVMPAILLKLPPCGEEDFSGQVRFGFGAGSDPRHQQLFEQRFGFPLIEAWAMTETGGAGMIVAHREPRHVGRRCIGRPPRGVAVRLVDENDHDVARGQDGELLVRRSGPDPKQGFFSGYFRDQAATDEGWRGGWWHTGDVVREGPDGSLYFVDRRKNVIRRSGENIAAVEVEAVLLQLDSVANCAVTAVPDEIRGDEVFALVVPSAKVGDEGRFAQDLFEAAMQRLSYFKAPGYIALVDELPLTPSQKISRADVKRRAVGLLASGSAADMRAQKKRRQA